MRTIQVKPQQSIEDVALEHYGAVEGVEHILNDNPLVFNAGGLNTYLQTGTEIKLRDEKLNERMYLQMQRKKIEPASAPSPKKAIIGPDFNELDYAADYQINLNLGEQ